MTVVHISSVPALTGHVGTRRDSKWDTILSWMGHHFAQMGHQMGHYLAPMGHHFGSIGHQMGHQSAKMGHKGTPTDTKMMSVGVMVKHLASRGVSRRFLRTERPKNRVRVAKTAPEPFCDFRRLWYTSTNKFSAQQGWRHGVRSRSLGGI